MMKDDNGSILVLGIGLGIIAITLVTTLVNISTVWIARNNLDSVADGAALAAVQAVDTRNVYTQGLGSSLRLNSAQARSRAVSYINKAASRGDIHRPRITAMTVGAQSVSITLTADVQVPFGYLASTRIVTASSRANAINRLR